MRGGEVQSLETADGKGGPGAVAWTLYTSGVYVFLYAPLACLTVLSFNDTESVTLPWRGFTARWYIQAFRDDGLRAAFMNSMMLALSTVVISVPIAVLGLYAFRRQFRLRASMLNLVLVALITPAIVVGVAQSIAWNLLGLSASLFGSTLMGHVIYAIPFVFVIAYPSFRRLDPSLEEAAFDLGASERVMFWTILLPLVKPGVLASAVFAFMLSFDEFIRTFFLIGSDNTLPIYLWSMMLTSVSPEANAIGFMMIVLSVGMTLLGSRLLGQAHRVG